MCEYINYGLGIKSYPGAFARLTCDRKSDRKTSRKYFPKTARHYCFYYFQKNFETEPRNFYCRNRKNYSVYWLPYYYYFRKTFRHYFCRFRKSFETEP
jgi:hypothetical protein